MRGSHLLGYKVYYQKYTVLEAAPTDWSDTEQIAASETTTTVTGLVQDTEYRLRIVAINIRGESDPSYSVT